MVLQVLTSYTKGIKHKGPIQKEQSGQRHSWHIHRMLGASEQLVKEDTGCPYNMNLKCHVGEPCNLHGRPMNPVVVTSSLRIVNGKKWLWGVSQTLRSDMLAKPVMFTLQCRPLLNHTGALVWYSFNPTNNLQ